MTSVARQNIPVMTWDDVAQGSAITTQFQFWEQGALRGEIVKNALLPFMDYEPAWARQAALYSMPFDVEAGTSGPSAVSIGGVSVSGLVCSEVGRQGRARVEASGANVLIAAGSEAMFEDDGMGIFSLHDAQYPRG